MFSLLGFMGEKIMLLLEQAFIKEKKLKMKITVYYTLTVDMKLKM